MTSGHFNMSDFQLFSFCFNFYRLTNLYTLNLLMHTQHTDSETKVSDSHPVLEGATELSEAFFKDYLEQEIGKVRTEFGDEIQQLQDQVHQLHALVEELTGRMKEVERKQSE